MATTLEDRIETPLAGPAVDPGTPAGLPKRGVQMKAIVNTRYGPPDVLQLAEVERPAPKEHEVLIKVEAASANPLDIARVRGTPFLLRVFLRIFLPRFSDGVLRPKSRLGADVAGRVEAVGAGVTQFQPGDEVFGDIGAGAFAEYACAPETRLALKPAHISFEAAAAAPVTGFTALQGLRDKGHIQAGQNVLINGASGGVGTMAVQMAKSFGAEVTAVCSTRNLDLVRSIGADHVVDYTQQDFAKTGQRYDLIFDAAANHSASAYERALSGGGTCVVAGFSNLAQMPPMLLLGPRVSKASGKKIGFMGIAKPNPDDLMVIQEMLETGKVLPVIDRTYPLSQVPEAIRYLEGKHARGKIVISIGR